MRLKKLNFLIVLLSIIAITNISIIVSANDAWSLMASDRDHDGILDDLDECPLVSENYNKFEDSDGCPDSVFDENTKFEFPDTDGDGFEDRVDNCVNLPETFNDYLDHDGCPERVPNDLKPESDSDSDSIPDSIDACPMEKETINEFKDADGCPDLLTPTSKISNERITDENHCFGGKVSVIRFNYQESICILPDTAKRWEELGIAKIVFPSSLEQISELEEIDTITTIDENLPPIPPPSEIPPLENNIPEISRATVLETKTTIIGQDIFYPEGTPLITSSIVTIPVGSETGNHIHEYPLFAFVLKGEVTVDYQSEGSKIYVEGDAIMEAINFTHNGKNTGDEPTEILVVTIGEE